MARKKNSTTSFGLSSSFKRNYEANIQGRNSRLATLAYPVTEKMLEIYLNLYKRNGHLTKSRGRGIVEDVKRLADSELRELYEAVFACIGMVKMTHQDGTQKNEILADFYYPLGAITAEYIVRGHAVPHLADT